MSPRRKLSAQIGHVALFPTNRGRIELGEHQNTHRSSRRDMLLNWSSLWPTTFQYSSAPYTENALYHHLRYPPEAHEKVPRTRRLCRDHQPVLVYIDHNALQQMRVSLGTIDTVYRRKRPVI